MSARCPAHRPRRRPQPHPPASTARQALKFASRDAPRGDRVAAVAGILDGVGCRCGQFGLPEGATDTMVISSGQTTAKYGNGHVSPDGRINTAGSGGGISWTSSGRLSGRSGSGTFRRSDGCTGTWAASKQ